MQMSMRISGFQASPIRRLVPYSREAEKRGVHVIHLNIGQPDIRTPKEAMEAVRSCRVRRNGAVGVPVKVEDIRRKKHCFRANCAV